MGDQQTHEIDTLLEDFVEANEENASESLLIELIEDRLKPIVEKVIRGKLYVSLQPVDERQINQDALELASEIKTLIMAKLFDLKSILGTGRIDSLEAYAKAVAANTCNQYLRKKYPFRLRLKNQLRYLLSHDRRFSEWQAETGEWLCGLREWKANDPQRTEKGGAGHLTEELRRAFEKDDFLHERSNLVDLIIAVFKHCRAPLRFAELVSTVYELRGIKEPVEVPEDEAAAMPPFKNESDVVVRLEQSEFLKHLWDEIGQLPLRHRSALLLNLKNSQGDGLIALLPLSRIASVRQIAEMLEFPIEEFARIWNELPWDDLAIADHLKLTRQQVINLRQSARATLRRRFDHF